MLLLRCAFLCFGVLLFTQPAEDLRFASKKQPKTQRTKFGGKMWRPWVLTFLSELFWTYLDFFGLYSTQPTNEPNPKLKKQLESQRKKCGQKPVNNYFCFITAPIPS
jgi:hypothetical protein